MAIFLTIDYKKILNFKKNYTLYLTKSEIIKKWVEKIEVYDDEIIVNFKIEGYSSIHLVAGDRLELPTSGL